MFPNPNISISFYSRNSVSSAILCICGFSRSQTFLLLLWKFQITVQGAWTLLQNFRPTLLARVRRWVIRLLFSEDNCLWIFSPQLLLLSFLFLESWSYWWEQFCPCEMLSINIFWYTLWGRMLEQLLFRWPGIFGGFCWIPQFP